MKKILLALLFCAQNVWAGTFSIGTVAGQESVSWPRSVVVDLVEVNGYYRFDSGVIVGGFVQNGYPNNGGPAMNLTTGQLGYSLRLKSFAPYVLAGYGQRTVNNLSQNYYQYTAGTRYNFNDTYFADVQYRYRNSDEFSNWRTNRYLGGVGVNFTKHTSAVVNYAVQSGDFKSQQYGVGVFYRF